MKQSQYKPIQQIVKHRHDCIMLNGLNGNQPWCLPEQKTDYSWTPKEERIQRDLTGRKNPKAAHTWVVLRCSDTHCPAQLAIYWNHFESLLNLSNDSWKEKEEE